MRPGPCIAVFCLLLAPSVCVAREVWEYKWLEARTTNFHIFSILKEKHTTTLAADLENFRTIVVALAGFKPSREYVPTYLYAVASREKDLGLTGDRGGYFVPTLDANLAVSRSVAVGLDHVVQHEYIHYLIANAGFPEYPSWMEEGLAEVLAAAQIRGAEFTYGDVPKDRAAWLMRGGPWLKYDDILASRGSHHLSSRKRAMYYAQSWVLMHYLLLGRKERNFQSDTLKYLNLLTAGAEPVASFEEAYALKAGELRGAVRSYLTRDLRYYKGELRADQLYPESAVQVRKLAPDEGAAQIGFLLSAIGNAEAAKRSFQAALDANPGNTLALSGLAEVLSNAGDLAEANALARQALGLAPDNTMAELASAEVAHDKAEMETDPVAKTGLYEEALRHAERAASLEPSNAKALWWQGHLMMDLGRPPGMGLDKLLLAHSLHQGNPQLKLLLARAYVKAGEVASARHQLERIMTWSHVGVAEAAEKLLSEIDPTYVPMPDFEQDEE